MSKRQGAVAYFFCRLSYLFVIGHAMLAIHFAMRALSSVWEASKEKNISLKKVFAIKAPLQINLRVPLYKKIKERDCTPYIFLFFCGRRGIRTPGTLIEYVSLANWWFQPLTHPS